MKKDKQWILNKWTKERDKTKVHDQMRYLINAFIADIIQLEEPDVLSQDWIGKNVEYAYFDMLDGSGRLSSATAIIKPKKLQNLFVPKQELPVIPRYVADWIEIANKSHSISWLLNYKNIKDWSHELTLWCFESGNDDNLHKLARAWLDGYEVEEETKYHALIKGHELADGYDIYWNYDKFDDGVFVSRLHPSHDNFLTEMSKSEWNKLGINDSNADFVKVDE